MRRDLERYFAGLAAEYEEEVAADGGPGGPDEDEDEDENNGEVRARIRLRRADTVPPLFAYQRELVEAVEDLCRAREGATWDC